MAADLFGLEQQTPRTNSRPEAAALVEVLKALRTHPAVPSRVRARDQFCKFAELCASVPSRVRAREPVPPCGKFSTGDTVTAIVQSLKKGHPHD